MAKFIAIFNDTLGDIEINGFTVMSEKDVERYENLAYSITWGFSYSIGNEELHYTSGEDLLTRVDFKEISSDEVKSLKKVFNNEFGVFISEDHLENIASGDGDDEEDWDEEDDYGHGYGNNDDQDDDY